MIANQTAVAFAVATLGIASFSAMDAVMKHLAIALGTYNALLWRTGAAALIGGAFYFGRRMPWPGRQATRIHLVRGSMGAVMAVLFFWGLARVPMAQAIALAFIAPIISLYLAAILLKEKIERRAIAASLLGFAGVVVILSGQARADLGPEAFWGSLSILASACLYAWNIILMRQQAQVAKPLEAAFFTSAVASLGFLLAAPVLAAVPPAYEWPAILGAALLSVASLMLLAWAYARAEAQHLAPVEYTAFIWAAILGFLFFAEPVRLPTLAGAAMIVAACIVAARRGRQPAPALQSTAGVPGGAA